MAVCRKTFEIYNRAPYASQIVPVPPRDEVSEARATPFDCRRDITRTPRETKGDGFRETKLPDESCCGGGGCN